MRKIFFLSVLCTASIFFYYLALAQSLPWQKSAFESYINGDGSSIEQAVIIKVEGLSPCKDKDCLRESFRKISRQEYRYISQQFGQMNRDWELEGMDNLEVDIQANDKFYDKLAIRLGGEQKIIYFDITDPVLKLKGA